MYVDIDISVEYLTYCGIMHFLAQELSHLDLRKPSQDCLNWQGIIEVHKPRFCWVKRVRVKSEHVAVSILNWSLATLVKLGASYVRRNAVVAPNLFHLRGGASISNLYLCEQHPTYWVRSRKNTCFPKCVSFCVAPFPIKVVYGFLLHLSLILG